MQNYQKYHTQGVEFVGLTPDGGADKADTQAFIDRFGIEWPNAYGARETISGFGVAGFPTVFVIGADGKVAWNDEMGGSLDQAIAEALTTAGAGGAAAN